MAVARDLMEQTPLGAAEKWVRAAAHETGWPRKAAWLLASGAVLAAVILVGAVIVYNDPVLRKLLSAPVDDEPYSAEEQAEVEQARQAIQAGQGVPLQDFVKSQD